MSARSRAAWKFIFIAAAAFSFGAYRVWSLTVRKELSLEIFIGELLGAVILAILANWASQLILKHHQKGHIVAAAAVSAVLLTTAALIFLPRDSSIDSSIVACTILAGLSQLLIALYVATALGPKLASALAKKNRRLRK